jgi:hypothetical protein
MECLPRSLHLEKAGPGDNPIDTKNILYVSCMTLGKIYFEKFSLSKRRDKAANIRLLFS